MRRENGFTLITLLFLLVLAVFVAMVSFRIVPAYMDYYAVKNMLQNILADDGPRTPAALRKTFAARLNVNFIDDISADDLSIDTEGGMLTLSVPINRKEPLIGGISVSIDLEAVASEPLQ